VIKRSPPARYLAGLANGAALIPALRHSLENDRIDVLVIQEYWPARYDYLARKVDIPFIAAHQGVMDRRQLKFAKRRTFARAFAMTTQTHAEALKVTRFGATATPIANGVDSDFFVPRNGRRDHEDKIVLCVARLHEAHKRQGDLIRALALLPDCWRLRLIGPGPDREYLSELARSVGVEERVEFRGFIGDKAELRRHLQRCDVFALVSRREGMPLALLEAMSCGAAVVGTDIPGIAEVVEDGVSGLLVPLGDAERIAQRIEEAYTRRDELGRRAREAIERNYSEPAVAEQLAELIRAASNASGDQLRPRSSGHTAGGRVPG
jgi:glycosyltransferase involved in cell wall biosynthesis